MSRFPFIAACSILLSLLAVLAVGQKRSLLAWLAGATYVDEAGVIHQVAKNDCGVAAVRMSLAIAARPPQGSKMPKPVDPRGLTMKQLSESLSSQGLPNESWFIRKDQLGCVPPGSIINFGNTHYLVLDSFVNGDPLMRDPSLGRIRYTRANFFAAWTGNTVVPYGTQAARATFYRCIA